MATPVSPSESIGILPLVAGTIDQVVVNGEVDGGYLRVPLSRLAFLAYGEEPQNGSSVYRLAQGLELDQRYIDVVDDNYSFVPDLTPYSTVRPSLLGIVTGMAREGTYSPQDRREVLLVMQSLANIVVGNYEGKKGVLTKGSIRAMLDKAGMKSVDSETVGALTYYMAAEDDRFVVMENGNLMVPELVKETEKPPKTAVAAHMDRALLRIGSGDGTFTMRQLMATLKKARGFPLQQGEMGGVRSFLASHPYIAAQPDGTYVFSDRVAMAEEQIAVIDSVLPQIYTTYGEFTLRNFFGALRQMRGQTIASDEAEDLLMVLRYHPKLEYLGQGRYRQRCPDTPLPQMPSPTSSEALLSAEIIVQDEVNGKAGNLDLKIRQALGAGGGQNFRAATRNRQNKWS